MKRLLVPGLLLALLLTTTQCGPAATPEPTSASAVIAEQYGKVMITTGAASDATYKEGYTLVFQAYTPASRYLTGAVDLLAHVDPDVFDELSLGLAPFLVLELFGILQRLRDEGLTMLLVEQNVQMALAISDYAYVLADGRVALEGPSREVAKEEFVKQAYLGI